MKFLFLTLLVGFFGGGLWLQWSKPPVFVLTQDEATTVAAPGPKRAPVVVELFTSEGCSSCPPADALLTQLTRTATAQNVELIPLSEHVDYWNDIGWTDPFSSADFSERQRRYAQAFGTRGERNDVYTPQMIVDGRFGFVGSNATKAEAAIIQASQSAKAAVVLTRLTPASDKTSSTVSISIRITNLPPLSTNDRAEVMLAITEDGLSANVTRGENRGHRLQHTAVTRDTRVLGEFAASAQSFETIATVKLNENWQRPALRFVVFVQERAQRRILGAAALQLLNQ